MKKQEFINYIENEKNECFDELSDTAQDFCKELDVDCKYISDAVAEYCCNLVDIYRYDLEKWMGDNLEKVEEAIDEYGWDGCGHDLHIATQFAQRNEYLDDISTYTNEILQVKFCELVGERLEGVEQCEICDNAKNILDDYIYKIYKQNLVENGVVDLVNEFITEILGAE